MIAAFWVATLGLSNTLWLGPPESASCSLLFVLSLPITELRKIIASFAALFALCWMGLIIQKVYVSASDKSWYHGHSPQQCPVGEGVVVLQLVTDGLADLTLAILPITLIRHAMIPASQWKMFVVIFTAGLLTTLFPIVHARIPLGPRAALEVIAA
ncbi:hypothetical protein DFH08DRAFT_951131 [Mycena albidolilacea]|uniref:Integral membrane protein n=1 Tax=Mycena albidolilacea TaxID=1033008 RepID=A0AAD7AMJ8_9AGAR|nr:hypothetical protein DFH08DRAFT_951131 [Mycena albidolilacea]